MSRLSELAVISQRIARLGFFCRLKLNTSVWAEESILNLSQVDLAPFADYAAACNGNEDAMQDVILQVGMLDPFSQWALDLLLKRGKIYSGT